jgi:hypothetical protein
MDERDTSLSDEARRDRQLAEREIAEREQRSEPHHDLANPIGEPDPTEVEDPYEQSSEEPRDPPPPRNLDRLREGEGEG